jgi:uncharacterized membrane protein YdfJ with MMPL/SSD domain
VVVAFASAARSARRDRPIAKDGHAALVEFDIRGDKDKAADKIGPVLEERRRRAARPSGLLHRRVRRRERRQGARRHAFANDLKRPATLSIPITLIILVVAFGALVAAGIPLLLALTAVFATLRAVALPSHLCPMDDRRRRAVVLLIGLAVGVDYSMFYLRREREERAAGRSERRRSRPPRRPPAARCSISGLTVMVAMAGMFLTGDATFASFGIATMIVVAVAMLGSLTVLPALLSKLGDRVDRAARPVRRPAAPRRRRVRVWGAIVDRVLRRPLLSAVARRRRCCSRSRPALQLHTATPGPDTFPQVARRS